MAQVTAEKAKDAEALVRQTTELAREIAPRITALPSIRQAQNATNATDSLIRFSAEVADKIGQAPYLANPEELKKLQTTLNAASLSIDLLEQTHEAMKKLASSRNLGADERSMVDSAAKKLNELIHLSRTEIASAKEAGATQQALTHIKHAVLGIQASSDIVNLVDSFAALNNEKRAQNLGDLRNTLDILHKSAISGDIQLYSEAVAHHQARAAISSSITQLASAEKQLRAALGKSFDPAKEIQKKIKYAINLAKKGDFERSNTYLQSALRSMRESAEKSFLARSKSIDEMRADLNKWIEQTRKQPGSVKKENLEQLELGFRRLSLHFRQMANFSRDGKFREAFSMYSNAERATFVLVSAFRNYQFATNMGSSFSDYINFDRSMGHSKPTQALLRELSPLARAATELSEKTSKLVAALVPGKVFDNTVLHATEETALSMKGLGEMSAGIQKKYAEMKPGISACQQFIQDSLKFRNMAAQMQAAGRDMNAVRAVQTNADRLMAYAQDAISAPTQFSSAYLKNEMFGGEYSLQDRVNDTYKRAWTGIALMGYGQAGRSHPIWEQFAQSDAERLKLALSPHVPAMKDLSSAKRANSYAALSWRHIKQAQNNAFLVALEGKLLSSDSQLSALNSLSVSTNAVTKMYVAAINGKFATASQNSRIASRESQNFTDSYSTLTKINIATDAVGQAFHGTAAIFFPAIIVADISNEMAINYKNMSGLEFATKGALAAASFIPAIGSLARLESGAARIGALSNAGKTFNNLQKEAQMLTKAENIVVAGARAEGLAVAELGARFAKVEHIAGAAMVGLGFADIGFMVQRNNGKWNAEILMAAIQNGTFAAISCGGLILSRRAAKAKAAAPEAKVAPEMEPAGVIRTFKEELPPAYRGLIQEYREIQAAKRVEATTRIGIWKDNVIVAAYNKLSPKDKKMYSLNEFAFMRRTYERNPQKLSFPEYLGLEAKKPVSSLNAEFNAFIRAHPEVKLNLQQYLQAKEFVAFGFAKDVYSLVKPQAKKAIIFPESKISAEERRVLESAKTEAVKIDRKMMPSGETAPLTAQELLMTARARSRIKSLLEKERRGQTKTEEAKVISLEEQRAAQLKKKESKVTDIPIEVDLKMAVGAESTRPLKAKKITKETVSISDADMLSQRAASEQGKRKASRLPSEEATTGKRPVSGEEATGAASPRAKARAVEKTMVVPIRKLTVWQKLAAKARAAKENVVARMQAAKERRAEKKRQKLNARVDAVAKELGIENVAELRGVAEELSGLRSADKKLAKVYEDAARKAMSDAKREGIDFSNPRLLQKSKSDILNVARSAVYETAGIDLKPMSNDLSKHVKEQQDLQHITRSLTLADLESLFQIFIRGNLRKNCSSMAGVRGGPEFVIERMGGTTGAYKVTVVKGSKRVNVFVKETSLQPDILAKKLFSGTGIIIPNMKRAFYRGKNGTKVEYGIMQDVNQVKGVKKALSFRELGRRDADGKLMHEDVVEAVMKDPKIYEKIAYAFELSRKRGLQDRHASNVWISLKKNGKVEISMIDLDLVASYPKMHDISRSHISHINDVIEQLAFALEGTKLYSDKLAKILKNEQNVKTFSKYLKKDRYFIESLAEHSNRDQATVLSMMEDIVRNPERVGNKSWERVLKAKLIKLMLFDERQTIASFTDGVARAHNSDLKRYKFLLKALRSYEGKPVGWGRSKKQILQRRHIGDESYKKTRSIINNKQQEIILEGPNAGRFLLEYESAKSMLDQQFGLSPLSNTDVRLFDQSGFKKYWFEKTGQPGKFVDPVLYWRYVLQNAPFAELPHIVY